jgi:hypothetical protein
MSAFRLVRQLVSDGFADPGKESLELVRITELLSRWSAWREPIHEFPVRWLVKRDRAAVAALLQSYSASVASVVGSAAERRRQGHPAHDETHDAAAGAGEQVFRPSKVDVPVTRDRAVRRMGHHAA